MNWYELRWPIKEEKKTESRKDRMTKIQKDEKTEDKCTNNMNWTQKTSRRPPMNHYVLRSKKGIWGRGRQYHQDLLIYWPQWSIDLDDLFSRWMIEHWCCIHPQMTHFHIYLSSSLHTSICFLQFLDWVLASATEWCFC